MSITTNGTTIRFQGDWSTGGISDQYRMLRDYLQQSGPPPTPLQLDFSGITSLDACGCQLLATFITGLRRLGMNPAILLVPESLIATIRSMGFHQLCGVDCTPGSGQ